MKYKKLSSLLTMVIFTFGVALILLMLQLDRQVEDSFQKNIRGIDLVVGAKGSPLQLILASVYHSDFPTGNIPIQQIKKWARHPQVKMAVPLSYGDSYKGYRIIGTELSYPEHYGAELSEGNWWKGHLEVVLGSKVVNDLGLKIGDKISSTHGLDENGHSHDQVLFTVVGILKPNHTVLDQIILSDIPSVWVVHEPELKGQDLGHWTAHEDRSITAMLLSFKSKYTAMMLVRSINENSALQAAWPTFEIERLMGLIGNASDVLNILSVVILGIAALGIFISLFNKLEERKKDIALIRVMGGSRGFVFKMILGEGLINALLSFVLGWGISKILLLIVNYLNQKSIYQFDLWNFGFTDLGVFLLALGIGFMAALLPAIKVYKMQITNIIKHD